ncbi:hypothetical protein RYX36_021464 [Vicia faba]
MFRSSFPLLIKSDPPVQVQDTIITAWTIRHPTRNRNDPIARAELYQLSYIPPSQVGACIKESSMKNESISAYGTELTGRRPLNCSSAIQWWLVPIRQGYNAWSKVQYIYQIENLRSGSNRYGKGLSLEDDLELGQSRLLEVDNRVVVPAKTHLCIIVTPADVPHSWDVPSLGVKCDVVPGHLNQIFVLVQREGVYYEPSLLVLATDPERPKEGEQVLVNLSGKEEIRRVFLFEWRDANSIRPCLYRINYYLYKEKALNLSCSQ